MNDRRQAFRRDPIEVELSPEVIVSIDPIPWEQRNVFGGEVVKQHVDILNESVRLYVDEATGAPQLEAKLEQKFTDPDKLFQLGLLPATYEQVKGMNLYYNQVVELLLVICEVNDLPQLKAMIDPNSQTPTPLGGILSDLIAPGDDTQKTESGQDSSSSESTEQPSEPSPILSSGPS
jgi:hypothetical protein